MANPLDSIMEWYITALDSIRVARRAVSQAIPGAITSRHVFFQQPVPDCENRLNAAKEELERLVVLALTAVFERTLRDHLGQIPRTALAPGDPHRDAVRDQMLNDIEFWNISRTVIEVFPAVAPDVRGQAKQIVDYRNWVAHGHSQSVPPPCNVAPAVAHQRLTDFLSQAGVI